MSSSAAISVLPGPRPALVRVSDEVPDEELSVDQLGSRIVGLAGRLAAATCRWLLLVAAFDARDGAVNFGLPSTARWLSHCCGVSHRTAVEHVRVARALAAFPALAGAMSSGRLSYSHARAISRLARAGEQAFVDDLVTAAEHGTVGQLETLVRGLRTVDDNERDAPERTQEYLRHSWTSTSQWRVRARLDPERGAVVQAAVEQVARSESISQVAALVRLAEIGLAALADSAESRRGLRGDERAAVVIHLDAGALPPAPAPDTSAGESESRPLSAAARVRRGARVAASIRNGPGLPSRVIERLLCGGRIRTAVIGAGNNPLDVGRSRRVVTDRQFRALTLRDGGCAHPGCRSVHRLEAHYVRHWLHGGETNMANLVLLCERHHLGHHAGEFSIAVRGRRFVFLRADGRELQARVDPARPAATDQPLESEHGVAAAAARGSHVGDRLDRDYAIAVLAGARSRGRRSA